VHIELGVSDSRQFFLTAALFIEWLFVYKKAKEKRERCRSFYNTSRREKRREQLVHAK